MTAPRGARNSPPSVGRGEPRPRRWSAVGPRPDPQAEAARRRAKSVRTGAHVAPLQVSRRPVQRIHNGPVAIRSLLRYSVVASDAWIGGAREAVGENLRALKNPGLRIATEVTSSNDTRETTGFVSVTLTIEVIRITTVSRSPSSQNPSIHV